tara:strand:+ start:1582 stop:2304 length:723 start_codon:yes stop_codon:yes gene_type:complete
MASQPNTSPILYQEWCNLLFLHWEIDPKLIRPIIPDSLTIDTFNNSAWIGIIPFQMKNLRPRFLLPLNSISNFTEINLRTYVVDRNNRKGVWFFSLDTQNSLGNWIAQKFFHLNYRFAKTEFKNDSISKHSCSVVYPNSKIHEQRFKWRDSKTTFMPSSNSDSLEFFLTERYRLFSYNKRKRILLTGSIRHEPYVLNRPELEEYSTGLFNTNGFELNIEHPNSILASKGTKVAVYKLERV